MAKPVDLTGQRKGFLNIVEKAYKKNNNYYYKCVCDCGKVIYRSTSNLNASKEPSCGCMKTKVISKHNTIELINGMVQEVLRFVKNGETTSNHFMIGRWRMGMMIA